MQQRFLSQTPEFAAAVARRSAEAMCRAPWPSNKGSIWDEP